MRRVSVLVSTYTQDRLDQVLDCLDSLGEQSLMPLEILLVLDPIESLVKFYKSRIGSHVRIIASKKFGLSNARNAGVQRAKGDIVAFIDDDAVADPNWLQNLVRNYDDQDVVGVGGFAKPLWEGKRSFLFPEELDWIVGCSYLGLPEHRAFVRNPIGCNMSFRRNIFEKVGYFRTNIGRFGKNLLAGEEPEFSLRVMKMFPRGRIVYDPSAVVLHRVPKNRANLKYLLKRSLYEGLSKSIIVNSSLRSPETLSREDAYLKHILNVTIPSKLKRFYRFENLGHLFAVTASTAAVLVGFSLGTLQRL